MDGLSFDIENVFVKLEPVASSLLLRTVKV